MNTITNTTNNFSERFAKIKVMLNTTETIGKSTLVELNNQGEQIKNVNNKSNILYDQLKITKTKLNKIVSSMWITNLLFSQETTTIKEINISQLKLDNTDLNHMSDIILDNTVNQKFEMDEISINLQKLKSIAIDMNNEIKDQSIYINNLALNVDKLNDITHHNINNINKAIIN